MSVIQGMKCGEIMVSVILAVYNVEDYLRECLDSILGQTLSDIEVICVNDGSTDASSSILEEYRKRDSRIRVYTKENEGLGGASARNYGLERALGRYVSILDSDDFFAPDMLERTVDRAEVTQADLVIFGGYEYDNRTHSSYPIRGILDDRYIPDSDVFSCRDCADTIYQLTKGMAWNKLFRRSFLEKRGLRFQNIKFSDDAYFTFSHIALADRITVIREPFVNYRVNTGRSQTNGIANYADSSYLPYLKLKKSLMEWGLYETVKQSFINCAVGFMKFCYEKIDRCESFVYLHNKFRDEVFEEFGLTGYDADYFYDRRLAMWVEQVAGHTAEELLFLSARAHGDQDSTTGILRFQFPYDRIPENSRIVVVGDRIVGRNYISQAVLSGCYDVVLWVDETNPRGYVGISGYDAIKDVSFDFILISHTGEGQIREARTRLLSMGIPEERVIIGEDCL